MGNKMNESDLVKIRTALEKETLSESLKAMEETLAELNYFKVLNGIYPTHTISEALDLCVELIRKNGKPIHTRDLHKFYPGYKKSWEVRRQWPWFHKTKEELMHDSRVSYLGNGMWSLKEWKV